MSLKKMRESKTIALPQTFVTIQIHNQNIKNKYRQHRNSVLNELSLTENRMNDSLNKKSSFATSNLSVIKRSRSSEKGFKIGKNSLFRRDIKKDIIKESCKEVPEPEYYISPDIKLRLKQLTNISHQFQRACQHKKKLKKFICQTQTSYTLPIVEQDVANAPQKQNVQTIKKKGRWKQKLSVGKSLIEKIKLNANFYNKLKQDALRQKQKLQQGSKIRINYETDDSLKNKFLSPLIHERKSAPINKASTDFYNIFCSQKQQRPQYYQRKVQLQPIINLQQFATGGSSLPYSETDSCVNVGQFLRNRQKMQFLQKMYSYTKSKCMRLKEMKSNQFDSANLLSMVYYLQNQNNMTSVEKRSMRKKLDFVD